MWTGKASLRRWQLGLPSGVKEVIARIGVMEWRTEYYKGMPEAHGAISEEESERWG